MVRQAHHPEPSRRANHNDRNSKSQTIDFLSYLRFGNWNLVLGIFLIHEKNTKTPFFNKSPFSVSSVHVYRVGGLLG
jgi:hypothetical protein